MQKSFSASVIHLLVVLLFFFVGSFVILGSFLVDVQLIAIRFLLQQPKFVFSIGLGMLFIGLILFAVFYQMHKGRYYQIKMGLVKDSIIQEYIRNYWHRMFPKDPLRVILHSNQTIEVITREEIRSLELLQKIQLELGLLLVQKIGYRAKFIVTTVLT